VLGGRPNAEPGAGALLTAQMEHDSEYAAIIYQHEARGADATIADAIDAGIEAERSRDDAGGAARAMVPQGWKSRRDAAMDMHTTPPLSP
jgi:hypothetical protein